MKQLPYLFLLLVASLSAQDAFDAEKPSPKLMPNQKEFLNLPEEQRREYAKHFSEAANYFQQKRVFECLNSVAEAEKVFPESSELLNLRGSCYVEMRSFEKAMGAFRKALEISPKNTSIRFNVAEVLFVTKQWQEAHDLFQEILREIPADNISLARLIEFKVLLCKIKLSQRDEAVIMSEKYDFQDDSPFYYFSKAALAYEKENLLEAEEWLARAGRIFRDPNIIAPWQDTLVEFGYIKSFYGEDAPAEAP